MKNNISIKRKQIELIGRVIKVNSGAVCIVEVCIDKINKHRVTSYISGNMRRNKIKVIKGDIVTIIMTPYDINRGRVYKRH